MLSIPIVLLKATVSAALGAPSHPPAAVIESIVGSPSGGIQLMDYAEPGEVIKLGQHDTVVIGYLKSCWHEIITGGTITVGTVQSDVQGGHVERSQAACDGGRMLLTAQLANLSAGAAFRAGPKRKPESPPRPEFTLYGLSPVIEVKPSGTLLIERVDRPEERHEIALAQAWLTHGTFLDLAKSGVVLSAGGIYTAKAGEQEMTFKIDPGATSGAVPIISRLIRLQPAS
jgi:hypothetical protein